MGEPAPPRRLVGALGGLILALEAVAAVVLHGNGESWAYIAYDGIVGVGAAAVSLLVWARRPRAVVGPLLFAYTSVFVAMATRFEPHTAVISLNWTAVSLLPPVFAHLVLAYPSGRLDGAARWLVVVLYAHAVGFALATLAVGPADDLFGGCIPTPCPPSPPLLGAGSPVWFDRLVTARDISQAPLVALFTGLIVLRVVTASPRRQQQLLPVTVAAGLVAAVFAAGQASEADDTPLFDLAQHAVHLGLGVAFLAGYWSTRVERAGVADLLAQLSAAPRERAEPLLRTLLADPQLRIRPLDDPGLAPAPTPGRARSTVTGSTGPLAVIDHDATVTEDERLLAAVLGATGLALDNARLQEDLMAQLAEVRASRQRIVEAADQARRQLERDLHDGAQQRLLSVGIALQLAGRALPDEAATRELLDEAGHEVRQAITELRDLTRGLHPAVLSERGLRPALAVLAQRSPVPVSIEGDVPDTLPDPQRTAVYYLVSEALQNTGKHSGASKAVVALSCQGSAVRVCVADDGRGGVDPVNGSGLRGLRDRVEALGGWLVIRSSPGCGTELIAELPCGS